MSYVDAVAQAIHAARTRVVEDDWDYLQEGDKSALRKQAQAAIDALKLTKESSVKRYDSPAYTKQRGKWWRFIGPWIPVEESSEEN